MIAGHSFGVLVVLLLANVANAADPFDDFVRKTDPLSPKDEQHSLHLPAGFEIQLVASEPEIGKPMNMAFDARGRLWITQSREYPYAAPLDKPARDKIQVLSDFDANGRAAKVTTFAEGLNIPIGLCPYKNGVIAFSIPNIYFFEDADGHGRSDRQQLILGRFGFERDTHGLTSAFRRGFDGWIYADHGYNNETTLVAKDQSTVKMQSGNTYRFKVDGSHVEQYTWGQVNPFGLMFDSLGDLWSADCHSSPVYQLLRGAYYPSFGKPHDGLGFGPDICTHSHGSTAIAGMVHYDADNFPSEYRGNAFVGNVMTCRINRDSFVEHGSTRVAKEEPDFLISDDPWFRPVDMQLGPDGAIYVADFYNRIIGHYEVPLDHPGRDRERGRIWRIVYRGDKDQTPGPATFDLSQANSEQLIAELANANITRRMLAMNQLVDRSGQPAIPAVKNILKTGTAFQKVHGLWVLQRLEALVPELLQAAAADSDRSVRTHAMRVLSETAVWTRAHSQIALAGLRDSDPYVQRAAADALGRHPAAEHVRPLLNLRQEVADSDPQLLHVVRMALRNQLSSEGTLSRLEANSLSETDSRAIADVAVAIKSSEAGQFLFQHVQAFAEEHWRLANYLRHIARYAPEADMSPLAAFTRNRFAEDLDFQLALFKSIQEGTAQRGARLPGAVADWGADLAQRLLASADPKLLQWHNTPLKNADTTNPWLLEKRPSSDGDKESLFICSFAPGAEKLTGVLRSKTFSIPDKLSFFLAGHDGVPDRPMHKKNFIRLRDAQTQQVLAQSAPPRNDTAQQTTWDLSKYAGKEGFLEIVDGNSGQSYAWLAAGRFNPPVVPMPAIMPNQVDKRQLAAAELAASLHLSSLEPKLSWLLADSQSDTEARAAAGKALLELNSDAHLPLISKLLSNSDEPEKFREKLAEIIGEKNLASAKTVLVDGLRTAPAGLQRQLGLALASNPESAEALLAAMEGGQASARLLQEQAIKDRLAATKPKDWEKRLANLTRNLAPLTQERQKLIEERFVAFNASEPSALAGADIFKQQCALCHSMEGQGANIGPQLDGIGARGASRLLEDILDPSRNVDRAFRTALLLLKNGDVETGLIRREEGELLVLAESNGKEKSVPKKEVQERRESELSLMPDNFSEVIPLGDFNNLLAYLLSKSIPTPK